MTAADLFRLSLSNLARRKGRTVLTVTGVVIGAGALVTMISLGLGMEREVVKLFTSDELLRTLNVTRQTDEGSHSPLPGFSFSKSQKIDDADLEKIRQVPGVASVTPSLQLYLTVRIAIEEQLEGEGKPGFGLQLQEIAAVVPEEEETLSRRLLHGRIWTDRTDRECVLPIAWYDEFHPDVARNHPPQWFLGKKAWITRDTAHRMPEDSETFTIVGWYDSSKFGFTGRRVLCPLTPTLALRTNNKGGFLGGDVEAGTYRLCEVKVNDPATLDDVIARLKDLGYSAMSFLHMVDSIRIVFLIIEGFLACIGAIGLLVSLFGIANTMTMAVLERTREIGILKALGARAAVIRRLFILESAWIGALGGLGGLLLGWLIGLLLEAVARGWFDLPDTATLFYVSPVLVLGSVGFAVVVSILAGALPARRASRLPPVQSLRYEG